MTRGARKSAEMVAARQLIREGNTPAEAARKTGLTPGAISQDVECKALIANAEPGKLAKAVQMVKASDGRITAYEAAREVGIHQSAVSRSPEYRKFMETKRNA